MFYRFYTCKILSRLLFCRMASHILHISSSATKLAGFVCWSQIHHRPNPPEVPGVPDSYVQPVHWFKDNLRHHRSGISYGASCSEIILLESWFGSYRPSWMRCSTKWEYRTYCQGRYKCVGIWAKMVNSPVSSLTSPWKVPYETTSLAKSSIKLYNLLAWRKGSGTSISSARRLRRCMKRTSDSNGKQQDLDWESMRWRRSTCLLEARIVIGPNWEVAQ